MEVPGEEVEFEVEWGERFSNHVHGGHELFVVDAEFAAFVCGF